MNKYIAFIILLMGLKTAICQIPLLNEKNLIKIPDMQQQVRNHVMIDDMVFLIEKVNKTTGAFLPINVWTGSRVYYEFHESVSIDMRNIFSTAFDEWERNTPLKFIIRNSEENYILITQSDKNWSYIGMIGGKQDLYIVSQHEGVAIHELGHAIGLTHEHQRSDRDKFITIFLDNADPEHAYNFYFKSTTVFYSSYDFLSIMHYRKTAFSSNGHNTIEPRPDYIEFIDKMGQRDSLTTKDIKTVSNLYNQIPALISPENGIIDISPNNVNLIWSNVPEANSFQIQVSRDPLFQSITIDKIVHSDYPFSQRIFTHQDAISNIDPSATYFWRIRAISLNGVKEWSSVFNFTVKSNSPEDFWIYPAYPNPFNNSTTIKFELKNPDFVMISIYDILGKKISDLVSGFFLNGTHTVLWEASALASGVYYYQLRTDAGFVQTNKLVLMK